MSDPGLRTCCDKWHREPYCPTNKLVMCCHCFDAVPLDQLNILDSGSLEDVCKPCAEEEKRQLAERGRELPVRNEGSSTGSP